MDEIPQPPRVTLRRIEGAIGTLGDLSAQDHEEIDGRVRDEIAHVIDVLDRILDRRN